MSDAGGPGSHQGRTEPLRKQFWFLIGHPISGGRHTHQLSEVPGKLHGIAEPTCKGNLLNSQSVPLKMGARLLNALAKQVLIRRQLGRLFEDSAKMVFTQTRLAGQICQRNGGCQVCIDVFIDTFNFCLADAQLFCISRSWPGKPPSASALPTFSRKFRQTSGHGDCLAALPHESIRRHLKRNHFSHPRNVEVC